MIITNDIAAHLLAPCDFSGIKPGDWVFMWRYASCILDAVARPEQVVTVHRGQIVTKSKRTFQQANGYGSPDSKTSKKLRICYYTDDLRELLRIKGQVFDVMKRIGVMDFLGMPVSLDEAVALEALLKSYTDRLHANSRIGYHVTRQVRQGKRRMVRVEKHPCSVYRSHPDHPDSLKRVSGYDIVIISDTGNCFSKDVNGLVMAGVTDSQQVAIKRGVTCRRILEERAELSSV